MQIKDIFKKPISRPINGVVKADQLDASIVWQELDEYVITRELDQHFRKFLSAYLAAMDMPNDPSITSRMGIWISGFFGSGKSHFLKILSYLLNNTHAENPETGLKRRAIEFFTEKIKDPLLLADLKRAVGGETDVILFNIDSRADAGDGRSAILAVFWKVFNESQGICGEHLHLSEIERYLQKKGKYEAFKNKFQEVHGSIWESERDAYAFNQDEIIQALSSAMGKSTEASKDWLEKSNQDFKLTVENFAKRVKEYLDSKSKDHRIVFLVDEIGQFIGNDTHLMLNLQTIVEDLGRICNGRVWVAVTSQEDIDAVLGDIKSKKANDFSKIQGRFNTRLSLSSANTDEVIQARLLQKTDTAKTELEKIYGVKGEILKNQLSFSYDSSTLKNYSSAKDFVDNYPFVPYHFQLVQKIFESIRKAGAAGLHLSRGERSMLDAFQSSAVNIAAEEIGSLAPLYEFYPCIESFLDTSVKRSIDQAKDNQGLSVPFDIHVLQTLFLIRYVDIIKPNVDNLTTLCIQEADTDRIDLKKKLEAALQRLEKETLINRNGDLYFFMTNEEREVANEIKGVHITSAAETQLLGDIVFDDILKGKTKHRYDTYHRDYAFNRICDQRLWGKELKDELGLEIISPLHDEFHLFTPEKCILYSANQSGNLIVRMEDAPNLVSEIRMHLQVAKYIQEKSDAAASENLKQILRAKADENRDRKNRLIILVENLIENGIFYALGKRLETKTQTPSKAIEDGMDYLVQNIYTKFGYLSSISSDPVKEITQILHSDDVAQHQLALQLNEQEPADIKEVKAYIDLKTAVNHAIVLDETARQFSKKPYGWNELQVVILIAKLYMAGIISLVADGAKIKPKEAVGHLTKTHYWKNVKIIKRISPTKEDLQKAQKLGKELFGQTPLDGQDKIAQSIREGLKGWIQTLEKYKPLADTGNYPGKQEIDGSLKPAEKMLSIHDAYELIKAFNAAKDELLDIVDDLHVLNDFYTHQLPVWEKLRNAMSRFSLNKSILEKHPDAGNAFKQLAEILNAPSPYKMIKEVNGLIAQVDAVNDGLVAKNRESAAGEVDRKINQLIQLLDKHNAESDFRNKTLYPLQQEKKKIFSEVGIPQISYSLKETQQLFEEAVTYIDQKFSSPGKDKTIKQVRTIKPASLIQKVYIETEADVDEFVITVKKELLAAVKNNMRVKIV